MVKIMSRKKRININISTEADMVGVDDVSPYILWKNYFIQAQGCNIEKLWYIKIIRVIFRWK